MTTYTESHNHIDHNWNTDGWIGWDYAIETDEE